MAVSRESSAAAGRRGCRVAARPERYGGAMKCVSVLVGYDRVLCRCADRQVAVALSAVVSVQQQLLRLPWPRR